MPTTRSGADSSKAKQKSLDELPGVSASRKTGGGKRANEQPTEEKPLKKAKADTAAGGGSGTNKAAPQSRQKQQDAKQDVSADDSRAIVASVDTGDPQDQLQRATKQTGLQAKPTGGSGGGGGSAEEPVREMQLDKSEHKHAEPAAGKGPSGKAQKVKAARADAEQHPGKVVKINRAPVLTLWAKKVAEREGYDEDAALTFGKAISGLMAQSKGRRIGVFDEKEHEQQEPGQPQADKAEVFGMRIKVTRDGDSVRATESGDKAMNPQQARGYLKRAFGDDLADVEAALGGLAESLPKKDVGKEAYRLYEKFRPTVPDGQKGWGQKADLDLAFINSLAEQHRK
jgi:hypothetical protein